MWYGYAPTGPRTHKRDVGEEFFMGKLAHSLLGSDVIIPQNRDKEYVSKRWFSMPTLFIFISLRGENAVFEAKKTATLKGGGSWINLDASGVAVGGARIMLGGGATGTARKAPSPQFPGKTNDVEGVKTMWQKVDICVMRQVLLHAQKAAQPVCEICGS